MNAEPRWADHTDVNSVGNPLAASNVSVVIATYHSEKPENLTAALESIYGQTLPPFQVIIVFDGPIGEQLEVVARQYASDKRVAETTFVRLSSNLGLAHALNAGLAACKGEWLMRMDSDDICSLDRLELQLRYVNRHPETDILGSWSEEFFEDGSPSQLKTSSVTHSTILRSLRWRNVLVHPTLLIRTETLRKIGGYRATYALLEDYDLFVRLAMSGSIFHVIPKVLVRVRSSIEQKARRGGLNYCLQDIKFRKHLLAIGFLTRWQFVLTTTLYTIFRLIPARLRKRAYVLAR